MTLEDLGNIGEFVAAIGVVASLIYLAVQIRQNTKSSRVAANQSVTASYIDLNTRLGENEGLADVVRRGLRDVDALSDPERGRFYSYLTSMILILANQYAMYRQGVLTEPDWEPAHRRAAILVSTPGGTAWWNSGEGSADYIQVLPHDAYSLRVSLLRTSTNSGCSRMGSE